jgi:hypothetical protein
VAGRSNKWITRSKSAEIKRATALSRERASPWQFIFQNETVPRLPVDDYDLVEQAFKTKLPPEHGVADFNAAIRTVGLVFRCNAEVWESVVPVIRWRDRAVVAIELHPITPGFSETQTFRGRPRFADDGAAHKIIADLQRFSQPFGTTIQDRDGKGVVVLTPALILLRHIISLVVRFFVGKKTDIGTAVAPGLSPKRCAANRSIRCRLVTSSIR